MAKGLQVGDGGIGVMVAFNERWRVIMEMQGSTAPNYRWLLNVQNPGNMQRPWTRFLSVNTRDSYRVSWLPLRPTHAPEKQQKHHV